ACLADATLLDADLTGAILAGSDVRGANLRGADLTRASLEGANLRNASLRAAILVDANLTGADMRVWTDFPSADLCGANRSGTHLSMRGPILKAAAYDNSTRWPENFDPRSRGALPTQEDVPTPKELHARAPPSP